MEDTAKIMPSDVGYQWTAMSYQEKLTDNQLYYLFGLSVVLVYLVLRGSMKVGFYRSRCCRRFRWHS